MNTATTTAAEKLDAATDPARIASGLASTLEAIEAAIEVLNGYDVDRLDVFSVEMFEADDEEHAEALAALQLLQEQVPEAEYLGEVWSGFLENSLAVEFTAKIHRFEMTVTGAEVTVTTGGPSVWIEADFTLGTVTACAAWGSKTHRVRQVAAPGLLYTLDSYADYHKAVNA